MIQRQRIDPDIEVKYHQIVAHMNEKNKVIQEFSRILKELCDWQMYNSRNLDKFANSISKLLIGKDPLKDTFIIFQRILASKSDQANKIAISIKQDMLPFLQQAIDLKEQTNVKNHQQSIKDLKQTMHQKIRQLYSAEVNYKNMNQKMKSFSNSNIMQSRERIEESTRIKRELLDAETYLSEVINVYNMTVEDYMLNYSGLCEQLGEIESRRKTVIKESISKYIVFQMDGIKNIEYDLSRHAKSIEKMEDKLIIQQKVLHEEQFKGIHLAKISSNNYINHLVERQKEDKASLSFQTESQRKLNEIKKFLDPLKETYELQKDSFENLMIDINDLLWQAMQVYDIKTVKQIVHYSSNFYSLSSLPNHIQNDSETSPTFRTTKIPLLNAVLCHPIFLNQPFWERYNSRLTDIVQKQINTPSNMRKNDLKKLSLSLLSSDIDFMKKIASSAIIQRILSKYLKYISESSQNLLKSTDSLKTKTEFNNSKHKVKDQNHSNHLNVQQYTHDQDLSYF